MGLPAQPATGLELAGISGPDSPSQYLTFSLAGEMFAVGILNVKEIIECGHLTAIPMMPTFIRGVMVMCDGQLVSPGRGEPVRFAETLSPAA